MNLEIENFEYPTASIPLDNSALDALYNSGIHKFIASLIVKAYVLKAKKIAILSWNMNASARSTAELLAIAFSQQIGQRCALVTTEGIRFHCENYDAYNHITIPEVETSDFTIKLSQFVAELDKNYPFQIYIGYDLCSWHKGLDQKHKIAMFTDAQILLTPKKGYNRTILKELLSLHEKKKMNWIGTISIDDD